MGCVHVTRPHPDEVELAPGLEHVIGPESRRSAAGRALLEELFGLQVERTLTRRDAIIMAKVGVLLIIVVVVVIIIVVLVAAAASAATTAVTAASAGR